MKLLGLVVTFAFFALSPLNAEHAPFKGVRRDVVVQPVTDVVMPTLLAGGEFKTSIVLVNLSLVTTEVKLFFVDDKGNDLQFPIMGIGMTNAVKVRIPAKGSYTVQTELRPADKITEGWGFLLTAGGDGTVSKIGGYTISRIRDVETVTPFASIAEKKTLLSFDNQESIETLVSVINFETKTSSINFTAYDENGNILVDRGYIDTPGLGRIVLNFSKLDALMGKRGIIEIETNNALMATYGYRLNTMSGAMNSAPSLSLADWRAQ